VYRTGASRWPFIAVWAGLWMAVYRAEIGSAIRELARRGEAWGTSEARQMLEHGIETGRGECCLRLSPEQYNCLKRP
jgi:hypothetical protein